MQVIDIVRSSAIIRSSRVAQIEGMFDLPQQSESSETWSVSLPLDERDWSVGLICGPSGSGKSTIAREAFGDAVCGGYDWPTDRSLLDGFPKTLSIKDIVSLLSSVGFSSPPLWLRPFHVLSTGQQMRVTIARLLAEQPDLAVMDEFTSVVDRTVAQIGSAAIAKTVRRRKQKFVAVTCHMDVLEWLQPDWVYDTQQGAFHWRSLQRRPSIDLVVRRVHHSCWGYFRPYHYLSHTFNKAARCFVAFYHDRPIALQAVLPMPHRVKNLYRGHRAVCLPDYQGVGIGNALVTLVASAYRALGNRISSVTTHPALNAARARDPRWICRRDPSLGVPQGRTSTIAGMRNTRATTRLTATWEYIGDSMDRDQAQALIYG